MNTATTLLHDMRSQQLLALARTPIRHIKSYQDRDRIIELVLQCEGEKGSYLIPETFSTRNLSDKALEEIDALALRYLDQVR